MTWLHWVAVLGPDDGFDSADLFWWAMGIVAVLTALTLFWKIVLPVARIIHEFAKWFTNFRQDWDGTPEREGRDRVPGFPERMEAIDGELARNSGSSLKDIVYDTKRQVSAIEERQIGVVTKVDDAVAKVDGMAVQLTEIMGFVREHLPPNKG